MSWSLKAVNSVKKVLLLIGIHCKHFYQNILIFIFLYSSYDFVHNMRCIKSEDKRVLVNDEYIKKGCKEFFEKCLNKEYPRKMFGSVLFHKTQRSIRYS